MEKAESGFLHPGIQAPGTEEGKNLAENAKMLETGVAESSKVGQAV